MRSKGQLKPEIVYILFPLLILSCGIVGGSVTASCVAQYRIEHRGIFTDGTAFFTEYKSAGRAGGAYHVHYSFRHNGTRYNSERQARDEWVKTTKLPATIRIQFLPDNPSVNWPPDVAVHRSLFLEIVFVVFCLAMMAYLGRKILLTWRTGRARQEMAGIRLEPL